MNLTPDYISNVIEDQFPEIFRESNSEIVQFILAYYEWLETSDQTNKVLRELKDNRDIDSTISDFIIHFKDMEASTNNHIYLATLDAYMPIRDINILIERKNHMERLCVSKYVIYRACEDYLVKTHWFINLPETKKLDIRFDFYSTIVLGIREAFNR